MIIDAWINGAFLIILALIRLFPAANPEVVYFITSRTTWYKQLIQGINWFFPVDTLLFVLGFALSFELLLLSSRIIMWITSNISLGIFKSPK